MIQYIHLRTRLEKQGLRFTMSNDKCTPRKGYFAMSALMAVIPHCTLHIQYHLNHKGNQGPVRLLIRDYNFTLMATPKHENPVF